MIISTSFLKETSYTIIFVEIIFKSSDSNDLCMLFIRTKNSLSNELEPFSNNLFPMRF